MSSGITCSKCGRAVYNTDVDESGKCVLCQVQEAPHVPNEDEWKDLGRPEDK